MFKSWLSLLTKEMDIQVFISRITVIDKLSLYNKNIDKISIYMYMYYMYYKCFISIVKIYACFLKSIWQGSH